MKERYITFVFSGRSDQLFNKEEMLLKIKYCVLMMETVRELLRTGMKKNFAALSATKYLLEILRSAKICTLIWISNRKSILRTVATLAMDVITFMRSFTIYRNICCPT